MSEPPKDQEPKGPTFVAVDGAHLGHEMKDVGQTFPLANMFADDTRILGGDQFDKVYFRTESGNIYLIDEDGVITNSGESKKQGKVVSTNLGREGLQEDMLTVGMPYFYGDTDRPWRTTKITEIVATNERVYAPDFLSKLKPNPIAADFRDGLPSPAKS